MASSPAPGRADPPSHRPAHLADYPGRAECSVPYRRDEAARSALAAQSSGYACASHQVLTTLCIGCRVGGADGGATRARQASLVLSRARGVARHAIHPTALVWRHTSSRRVRAFPGHDGLHKYAGHACHRVVDAHDVQNADDVISRPDKRAPTPPYGRTSCQSTDRLPHAQRAVLDLATERRPCQLRVLLSGNP